MGVSLVVDDKPPGRVMALGVVYLGVYLSLVFAALWLGPPALKIITDGPVAPTPETHAESKIWSKRLLFAHQFDHDFSISARFPQRLPPPSSSSPSPLAQSPLKGAATNGSGATQLLAPLSQTWPQYLVDEYEAHGCRRTEKSDPNHPQTLGDDGGWSWVSTPSYEPMFICHRIVVKASLRRIQPPDSNGLLKNDSQRVAFDGDKEISGDLFVPMTTTKAKIVACHITKELCEPVEILRFIEMSDTSTNSYLATVEVLNTTQELDWMGDGTNFDIMYRNTQFSLFEGLLRVTCLVVGLIALLRFASKVRILPLSLWPYFHLIVLNLLLLQIGFNDFLFVLNFVRRSASLFLLGTFLRVTFLCTFAMYCLVARELLGSIGTTGQRQATWAESELKTRLKWVTFAFISANLWLAACGYCMWEHHQASTDPFLLFTDKISKLWPLHLWLGILLAAYFIWLSVEACTLLMLLLRSSNKLDFRSKVLSVMTVITIILTVFVTAFLGGVSPISTSLPKFTALQVLLNLYVVGLSHLFAFTESPGKDIFDGRRIDIEERQQIMTDTYKSDSDNTPGSDLNENKVFGNPFEESFRQV